MPNRLNASVLSSMIGIAVVTAISVAYTGMPLWIDELHTSWSIFGDWGSVADRASAGNQSPFYFYLLKAFVGIFGHSETTLRLFSVGCSCGAVLLLSWLCQRHKLPFWAAAITTLTFAAGHLQLLFAVEARSYSLLTLLVLCLFCVQTLRNNRIDQSFPWKLEGLWLFIAALCVYTHYIAIPAVASLAISVLFISEPEFKMRRNLCIVRLCGLGLIACTQFSTLQNIYHHRSQWAIFIHAEKATVDSLLTTLPVLSTILLPGFFCLVTQVRKTEHQAIVRSALVLAVLPLGMAWLTTRLDWLNWFSPRYLVASLPALSIFCGFSLHALWQQAKLPESVMILLTLLHLIAFFSFDSDVISKTTNQQVTLKQERWDLVVQTLNSTATAPGTVLLTGGLVEDRRLPLQADVPHTANMTTSEYCVFPLKGMYALSESLTIEPMNSSDDGFEQLLARISELPEGWLIARGKRRNAAIQALLEQRLGENGFQDHEIPGRVNLYFWSDK